jgi:dCTP deaminase
MLGNQGIRTALARGDIVIEPFNERNLGTDTYDVRLGSNYYHEIEGVQYPVFNACFGSFNTGPTLILDPFKESSIISTWVSAVAENDIILLNPGETILAHTLEFIGTRRAYTTKMFSRSSVGRIMVGVCKCAGRGDCGFFNRWTMEITSFSQHHAIILHVGMRIAQIEFSEVVGIDQARYGKDHDKYQQGDDLEKIMAAWKPEMMLPRLHLDYEVSENDTGVWDPAKFI